MSGSGSTREGVRAAVPEVALATIAERAPSAEVIALEQLEDSARPGIEFLVPIPFRQTELVRQLDEFTGLRVIQTLSAGVDALEDAVGDRVTLCSARGARDGPVAEWIVGALLGAGTQLLRAAHTPRWSRGWRIDDLSAQTVLIVGMGSIGEAVRARLEAFGTTVIGVASRPRDGLRGVQELPELLPRVDAVVLLVPLSDTTRGLIDAGALAALRDGALVVNAARGPVLDAGALLAETRSGRLRAVLDVTDPEPLPDEHPLWSAPGVLAITPHIGGTSDVGNRRAAELAGDQLARWCAGEPLRNIVHEREPA